jgi:hypothetical protein
MFRLLITMCAQRPALLRLGNPARPGYPAAFALAGVLVLAVLPAALGERTVR